MRQRVYGSWVRAVSRLASTEFAILLLRGYIYLTWNLKPVISMQELSFVHCRIGSKIKKMRFPGTSKFYLFEFSLSDASIKKQVL